MDSVAERVTLVLGDSPSAPFASDLMAERVRRR